MSVAISVENLSKSYIISHKPKEKYSALRDVLIEGVKSAAKRVVHPRNSGNGDGRREEFWALRDISFEVQQGDRVGIIGRNGAGKSTLLKILSRITEPSSGKIRIKGRVASLLEVGTGFHPELTGRENIFMNGSILGMAKAEIRSKFDQIVSFAEVERFLDTPVKRYSSGMYVRLAFAVAAHLEPEILVVDEVLAVGDAEFQKKCLGRMSEVSSEGRTVLFVSHNMGAIRELCTKAILLSQGGLEYEGDVGEVVTRYTKSNVELTVDLCARRAGSGGIRFTNVFAGGADKIKKTVFEPSEPISVYLETKVSSEYHNSENLAFGIGIDSQDGQRLLTCVSTWIKERTRAKGPKLLARFELPTLPLAAGRYFVSASVSMGADTLDYVEHCAVIEIAPTLAGYGLGRAASHGHLNISYKYEILDV